jgi:hypothetical protein
MSGTIQENEKTQTKINENENESNKNESSQPYENERVEVVQQLVEVDEAIH